MDILSITEVNDKFNIHNTGNSFVISGYDYVECSEGRGVGMFIKNSFTFKRSSEYETLFKPSIFGILNLPNNKHVTIGLVYRSPNCSDGDNIQLFNQIDVISKKFLNTNEKLVIMGDFNFKEIDWSQECCNTKDTHNAHKFLSITQQNYLTQFVTQPTHYRAQQTPTLIDLILSNDPEFIKDVTQFPPFGKSHHTVMTFALDVCSNVCKNDANPISKFQIDKGNYPAMRESVGKVNWEGYLNEEGNVNDWWGKIENTINEAKNKFIPKKRYRGPKIKRTFTAPFTLLQKVQRKRQAFKHYKKYPSVSNYNIYAKYRNQVKWETRKAKKQKEQKVALDSKKNPKALFQYINSKNKSKETIPDLLKPDGSLSKSTTEKCNMFNSFFASVFTKEGDGELPVFDKIKDNFLENITITEDQMYHALNSLNISKSPGPDEIHPRILKELSKELAKPLSMLFNKSIKEGKIPDKWKIAEVRPIFKKGSKQEAGNYRPVSLTSVVCKVFESFVRDAMYSHFISNNLLSDKQFGFCQGRSCMTQLLVTLHDWMTLLDKNIPVDCMYLDFRKAFDAVPHKRLLHKIKGYGVRGNILNWVTDFLSNRTQYVSLDGFYSESTNVTSGVPQGSVLGPTLFIYYINDLPDVVDTLLRIFADDTKSYDKIENTEDQVKLQNSIDNLVKWSHDWLLGFNCDKCKCLHLGKNNKKCQYTIQQNNKTTLLGETTCEKDLGINIDPDLNFEKHIEIQTKKARALCGMIMRTFVNKTPSILIPIFKSLIRPVLEYGNVVWHPYLRKNINEIEKVQRNFTKNIIGMKNLDYESRLRTLKLPSLEYRRIRGDMIEVYKILYKKYDPLTTHNLFTLDTNNTRGHKLKLKKFQFNTDKYKHFFTNRVVNLWNSLPGEVVYAPSLNVFKNKIDSYLQHYTFLTDIDIWNLK